MNMSEKIYFSGAALICAAFWWWAYVVPMDEWRNEMFDCMDGDYSERSYNACYMALKLASIYENHTEDKNEESKTEK